MGTLSHHRAANRFQIALQQRLEALISIAIDEVELNQAARALATDPDAIDFPETNAQSHSNSTSESQP